MLLEFLRLPPSERRLHFEEAARRRGLSPVIIEKDFWVCWMLGVLFEGPLRDVLVFKGGTSLSKVYGVVQRFSEDIDLSLAPRFVGLSEPTVSQALSRNQAARWMKAAEAACGSAVRESILPELEASLVSVLGAAKDPWLEFATDEATHSPVLLFRYPTTQPPGFGYLRRSVKLEFGSLTDQEPVDRHPVRPWLADEVPEAFQDWRCDVVSLQLERTFWEKATLLHGEHHRATEKPVPDRYSRHYADTAALAIHPVASKAASLDSVRERVVNWKATYFSAWAR